MLLLIWDIQTFVNGNVSILSNQTIFMRRCLGIESKHGYLDAQTLTVALLDLSPKRLSNFLPYIIAQRSSIKRFVQWKCLVLTLLEEIKYDICSFSYEYKKRFVQRIYSALTKIL